MARTLTRRSLLKAGVTAGAAIAAPTILMRKASAQTESTLKIIQWKHFVPEYDNKYFANFTKQFGEKHKCKVEVDYVATSDLNGAEQADIARGGGHDILHLNGVGAWFFEQALVDVSDVADKLAKEFGGWIPNSESIGKVKGKWLAVPYWYIAYPMLINRGYFKQVGANYTDKTTWQELLGEGAKLKSAGHPFGIPFSQTPDANDDLYPFMASYGAYMFDKEGKISFRRKEIADALAYGKQFFEKTMTDEVLSWDDSSNNRFIASGKGSLICNPISAYRTAAKDNPDVYRNLEVVKTPLGPKGRANGARTMSYGIYNFSKNQELAKTFLHEMIADSRNGMEGSTGYNHPFLKAFTKKPMPVIGSEPKLELLQDFQNDNLVFIGHPGPMTRTATGMYAKFIIPTMFAEVAKGKPIRAAMDDAEKKLRAI
jgi:multiple sugar transport system substrate-binding protein